MGRRVPGQRHSSAAAARAELDPSQIPPELEREIRHLHDRLGSIDQWQLLGVRWNAPVEEVRAAYLEKVRVFHPDRHGGRRLGELLPKLERVFHAITSARDELADPARRVAYARKTAPPEEFARMEARRLVDEGRKEERRERLARANPLVGRASRVQELVTRGKAHLDSGRFAQAANDFLAAAGLDPRHREARELAERARRSARSERARELHDRALAAEAAGQLAAAAEDHRQAAEADPTNPKYAVAASRASLQAGDSKAARALAEGATRAAPSDASAHQALAAALYALGDGKGARQAVDRALELDPSREGARALSKKLRWGFLA